VLGALASGILLFGMSLTYGFTGTTSFEGIRGALDGGLSTGALFGLVFVLAGLAFKISAVPFHMWTPDVYEGAPTPVTTFFASAPKVAAVALTTRVAIEAFGTQVDAWRQVGDLRRAGLDRGRRARRDRAGQPQAAARLFVDQQRRLHPDRPRLRHGGRRERGAGLSGDLRRDDRRQLRRGADAQGRERRTARGRVGPRRPLADLDQRSHGA
jgi:hypothetical protein